MYTFEQKNQIILRLASAEYFYEDKELFFKNCSNSKLERDLRNGNEFTHKDLDGRMLNELLSKVTEEEITSNRNGVVTVIPKKIEKKRSPKPKVAGKKKKAVEQQVKSELLNPPIEGGTVDDKKKEQNGKNSQA